MAASIAALIVLGLVPSAQAASTKQGFLRVSSSHAGKVPDAFASRLKYALPDGSLRVIVATGSRDAGLERFVRANTLWRQWYGTSPRFLARVTPSQLDALLDNRAIRFAEPDYKLTYANAETLDTNARGFAGDGTSVWSFDALGGGGLASEMAALTTSQATGVGSTVAIVDSGIDLTHKDFGGFSCTPAPYKPCDSRVKKAVVTEHLVGAGSGYEQLPTTEAASGHGTHVAGIIAGDGYYTRDGDADESRYGGDGYVFGVAPQASLVSVKNGDTLWAGLSSFGLQWILDNHQEFGIRVINNSWGCVGGCAYDGNSATAQLFRDLYKAGIVTLFAGGNDGGTEDGAAFNGNAQSPYTLGVAAYNVAYHRLADFSSRGDGKTTLANPATWTPESEGLNGVRRPDVSAPGVDTWSARTLTGGAASLIPRVNTNDVTGGASNGFVPYAQMSGTSMATPHVAGAVALLFSACPKATALDAMRAIMVGADPAKILQTTGTAFARPFETGYGGVDVRASMDWLLTQPNCSA